LFVWLVGFLVVVWLSGWLAVWLAGCLVGWLSGWLVGWLSGWSFGWMVVWLVAAAAVFKVRIISTGQCSLEMVEIDVYSADTCDVYINTHAYVFSKIEPFANETTSLHTQVRESLRKMQNQLIRLTMKTDGVACQPVHDS